MHFIVDYLCTFSFINYRHVANFRNITLLTHHPGLNPNKNVMNCLLNRVGHVCTPLHHIIRPHRQPDPQTTAKGSKECSSVPFVQDICLHRMSIDDCWRTKVLCSSITLLRAACTLSFRSHCGRSRRWTTENQRVYKINRWTLSR